MEPLVLQFLRLTPVNITPKLTMAEKAPEETKQLTDDEKKAMEKYFDAEERRIIQQRDDNLETINAAFGEMFDHITAQREEMLRRAEAGEEVDIDGEAIRRMKDMIGSLVQFELRPRVDLAKVE